MDTMSCEEYRELLLSAEPRQLRGAHEGHEHLQTCAACRAAAAAILAGIQDLNGALTGLTERHVRTPVSSVARPVANEVTTTVGWRSWRRWAPALAALATAATVLLMLWWQVPRAPEPLPPLAGPAVRVPASPVVNATGASGVAVMPTKDPDITVVWTY